MALPMTSSRMALLTVLTVNWLLSMLESHFSKWQERGADL